MTLEAKNNFAERYQASYLLLRFPLIHYTKKK